MSRPVKLDMTLAAATDDRLGGNQPGVEKEVKSLHSCESNYKHVESV